MTTIAKPLSFMNAIKHHVKFVEAVKSLRGVPLPHTHTHTHAHTHTNTHTHVHTHTHPQILFPAANPLLQYTTGGWSNMPREESSLELIGEDVGFNQIPFL